MIEIHNQMPNQVIETILLRKYKLRVCIDSKI